MSGRLALATLLAVPLLFLALRGLTAALGPLAGWGVGLALYWALMGAALVRSWDPHAVAADVAARSPGRLVSVLLALPVVVVGATAMRTLGSVILPAHLILAAAIAAVMNAFLEELFWRRALVPDPSPRALGLALGLYWLFHAAWLGARGLETGLSPPLLLLGPLALGGLWTASRLLSGTLGAGILSHAGLNLFLFVQVVALTRGALPGGAAPLP